MYIGSVRFFKNLILLAVAIHILIPSLLAIQYYRKAELLETMLEQIDSSPPVLRNSRAAAAPSSARSAAAAEPEKPAAAEAPSYQALYPDFTAPQPYAASERLEKTVYLTFDDGPSVRTDEILAILAEKGVKATFFVVGQSGAEEEKNLERMRKITEAGHTIGMHSFSHVYSDVYASMESFLEDFYRNFVQIRDTTGTAPTAFRFPGGSINYYNGGIYQEMISEMIRRGFVPFDWNISSEDATGKDQTAEQIVEQVVQSAGGKVRCIVLFHDSEAKVSTANALGRIIDRLREMGYRFESISPSTLPVLFGYTY